MKPKYPNVIVVEGKMDKDLILSFLDADIITTNGSEVSHETIELIRKVSQTRSVVVLTDPDAPGKRIRDTINQQIPGLANAFIPKDKAIKGHKLGVAESDKDTIMEALNNLLVISKDLKESDLTMADLFELGLSGQNNSSKLRERIQNFYHIDFANGKTLLKRLKMLGADKNTLKEVIKNG